MKLKVVTLCSGYDSQMMACRRMQQRHPELEFDLLAWAEIDKYAIQAHNAIFPEYADRNLGDITKADWNSLDVGRGIDILFYSTPCQSVSLAGKGMGAEKGSGTASSLLWETERAIDCLNPKLMIGENVKGLVTKKHKPVFDSWLELLEHKGYSNFWKVLNAKDYGVPQNRERVFTVSIREPERPYMFPEGFPLEFRLKHILEPVEDVDESYYLKQEQVDRVLAQVKPKLDEFVDDGEA